MPALGGGAAPGGARGGLGAAQGAGGASHPRGGGLGKQAGRGGRSAQGQRQSRALNPVALSPPRARQKRSPSSPRLTTDKRRVSG